ncbi:hypothetical protein D3C78_1303950 [compost metagenome]
MGRPSLLRLYPQGTQGLCRRDDGVRQAGAGDLLRRRRGQETRRQPAENLHRPARAVQQTDGERHRGLRDDRRLRRTGAHGRGRSEVRLQRQTAERDRRVAAAQGPEDGRTDHRAQADH